MIKFGAPDREIRIGVDTVLDRAAKDRWGDPKKIEIIRITFAAPRTKLL